MAGVGRPQAVVEKEYGYIFKHFLQSFQVKRQQYMGDSVVAFVPQPDDQVSCG